jgi:hypothetical protein
MSEAIGLIETKGLVGLVEACDAMVKAASRGCGSGGGKGGGRAGVVARDCTSARCAGRKHVEVTGNDNWIQQLELENGNGQ